MSRSHLLIAAASLVASPALAVPPPPLPSQTLDASAAVAMPLPRRVAHAKLRPFAEAQVRRADDGDAAQLWLAVRVGDRWFQAATPLSIWGSDGHTCHADVSKIGAIKLSQAALADGRPAVLAQIDVDYTTYMTCPEPPQRGDQVVGGFHERHFLLCAPGAAAGDPPRCAAPISTRQRDVCPRAATFKAGVLDAPCDVWQLDAQGSAIDLQPGRSTLTL